eukprot:1298886-Prymnesium_polylepis.1
MRVDDFGRQDACQDAAPGPGQAEVARGLVLVHNYARVLRADGTRHADGARVRRAGARERVRAARTFTSEGLRQLAGG